jgi:hypothetical protein
MSISSVYHSPSFESESFTQILPFNQDNPLKAGVQSDHAEIALRTPNNRIINIWNISNPTYHCYFKYGDNPPFHKTHLFVENPFFLASMDKGLAAKSDSQIMTIAERFVKGEVNVQVIVEGYESFYNELADKINALGHKEFQFISMLNEKPAQWDDKKNVTGILIDTSRFSVLESGVKYIKYREEQSSNEEKEFCLPFAHIRDKATDHAMVIAGVHINGCGSQYPKTGLETLAGIINQLKTETLGKPDVIAAGDYNTPPMHARKSVIELLNSEGALLKAPYPTHVNPKSQAGNYDQISILGEKPLEKYEILPASHLSPASQDLVSSIEQSRKKYLSKATNLPLFTWEME